MSPFIRPATAADVPLILDFIRRLADYEKLSHEVVATEETLSATLFPADRRSVAECLFIYPHSDAATPATTPAGFALYFFNYSTFLAQPGLYLEDLFIRPEFRGQGLGKALIRHLAHLANRHGCGRMEWSVLDWNQPAIAFYESIGAERKTDWTTCRLTGPALARYV